LKPTAKHQIDEKPLKIAKKFAKGLAKKKTIY